MPDRNGPIRHAIRTIAGGESPHDLQIRHAAWVARCVGRGQAAPLLREDIGALAGTLAAKQFASGAVLFAARDRPAGVWIVRQGLIELAVGSGRRRVVVDVLRAGDVDGDIPLLLALPMAYTARALGEATCLYLDRPAFEHLLATGPNIARRWLSSVAQRVSAGQTRLVAMLGRPCRRRSVPTSVTGTLRRLRCMKFSMGGYLASATAAVTLAKPVMSALSFLGGAANAVAIAVVTFILTAVNLVIGELVPKRLGMQYSRAWLISTISPMVTRITRRSQGLCLATLGRIPTMAGDRVELANWTIEVPGISHRTITEVRLTPKAGRRDGSASR